jgi:hypothetical protein
MLFTLAVAFFIAFGVLTYGEESVAFEVGETYDSIGSPYLWFAVAGGMGVIGSVIAIAVYVGATLVGRFKGKRS